MRVTQFAAKCNYNTTWLQIIHTLALQDVFISLYEMKWYEEEEEQQQLEHVTKSYKMMLMLLLDDMYHKGAFPKPTLETLYQWLDSLKLALGLTQYDLATFLSF